MAMTITDDCVNCVACVDVCLRDAVHEGDAHYEIDREKCTECADEGESACVKVCPVDCIVRLA